MIWLLTWHAIAALTILLARHRVTRNGFLIGATGPLAVLVWALQRATDLDSTYSQQVAWVPGLGLELAFRVDGFALVFLLVIGFTGTLIFSFAARYFPTTVRAADFAATMTLFGGAMVGLVASDHLLAVFFFWELTTITSYLLIGYDDSKAAARSAALHAALVTGAGGLAMLGGLILLADESGSYLISEILAAPPEPSGLVSLAWVLVLLGAITKSAQFPFHGWLPGAMAAPTPASAFLHSATMVKAGIFLAGRLGPAATVGASWWEPVVVGIGLVTMVVGGWQALRQTDLKLLLAYGTVSQLGLLFLLIGSGTSKLLFGGLALLGAHALFKAGLFLVVGTIDHEAGTRDLRRLSGLASSMRPLAAAGTVAAMSMAAVPLTYGFVAKEAAVDAALARSWWLAATLAAASILTVAYSGRFAVGAFGRHHEDQDPAVVEGSHRLGLLLAAPGVLAGAGLLFGLWPKPMEVLARSGVPPGVDAKLVAWPGFVPAFGWSMLSLVAGAILIWRHEVLEAAIDNVRRVSARLPSTDGAYRRFVSGLLTWADRASSFIQSGSLPVYLSIILLVAIILPASAFLSGETVFGELPVVGGPVEIIIGVVIVASAISAATVGRRFAAVILLGGVGYGVAGLYATWGGPDLSLTQILVETLAVALFALVLRSLPARFERAQTARAPRLAVAVLVAAFVFVGGWVTTSGLRDGTISDFYLAESVPTAQGANVVNVILVDFRGFDTLGEITVLATATLGVMALVAPLIRKLLSK